MNIVATPITAIRRTSATVRTKLIPILLKTTTTGMGMTCTRLCNCTNSRDIHDLLARRDGRSQLTSAGERETCLSSKACALSKKIGELHRLLEKLSSDLSASNKLAHDRLIKCEVSRMRAPSHRDTRISLELWACRAAIREPLC